MICIKVLKFYDFDIMLAMKKLIPSLFLILTTLASCSVANGLSDDKNKPSNQNTNVVKDEKPDGNNSTTGGSTNTGTNTEINVEYEENHQENTAISLDEWKNYSFNNGISAAYNDDWEYYHDTTYKPAGDLWKNPNEKADCSGIEFQYKKQYLISPNFVSYKKVEVSFTFWFSSHTSTKFKAEKDQPQFLIEEFNSSNTRINIDSMEITKNDIPKNGTTKEMTYYIRQETMTSFIFRFNNFIANGDSGYTAVLCKIALKGWNYD